MEDVREVYNKFYKNGDGKISSTELKEMLQIWGSKTTSEEVDHMMSVMDKKGDGFIDLKEFAEFHSSRTKDDASATKESATKELREAFDLYDLDKNGVISVVELRLVLRSLGEECSLSDCRRMISAMDEDGDGTVNFEEFKKMTTKAHIEGDLKILREDR